MDYLKSYPALEGLVDLANRDDVDISVTLLRVLTDLYVTKPAHSREEERQYTELALRLIDAVDVPTRQRLAQRLASYTPTPLPVVRRLVRDVIAVAEPILRYSHSLPVTELFAIAKAISPSHVAAIAARDDVKSYAPAEAFAPSAGPLISGSMTAGEMNDLSELFFAANATERRLILLNLDFAPLPPARPIAPQIASEASRRLEAAALSHNGEVFVRELARALTITVDQARRLADDQSGEPLVIAAKALGMPADVLQRILLCLNPAIGQSVQRVYALADLHEELKADAALRMTAIWQATALQTGHQPKPPAHQPQYVDDASRPRRDAPTWDRRAPQSKPADRRTGSKRDW
jgi:uncharacterized protein (DUF2336 family)